MKILLKNHYYPTEEKVLELDLARFGVIDEEGSERLARGLYETLSDKVVGIFSCAGSLFLYYDGAVAKVDSEHLSACFGAVGDRRYIVVDTGELLIDLDYVNSREPVSTPFYSENEEDADFGLWLVNVLNSAERRGIFCQANS